MSDKFRQLVWVLVLTVVTAGITGISSCNDSSSHSKNGYPNGNLLATATDLKPADVVILDARSEDAYHNGHIPGAVNLRWQQVVDASMNLLPVADLETLLGLAGLTRNSRLIIYDDTTSSWGAAGRLFWMFETLGCGNVRILNGGWDKWIADGNQPETYVNTLPAATFTARPDPGITATKEYIAGRMKADDFVIIDTRSDEEFNGWTLYGEARGGHITGAVQIPYEWNFQSDKTLLTYPEMKEMYESRGVTKDKEVTAYCTAGIRSGFAYFLCRLMGYQRVSNYDGSILDWATASVDCSTCYPMEQMANYQALVYPAWVDQLINNEDPPTYPGNGYVILYPSYEPRYSEDRTDYAGTVYETGHIPGAVFVDVYSLENGPNSEYGDGYEFPEEGSVKPIPELQDFLGNLGITRDTTVVVYANDDISMMTAGRTAWALLLAGVDDVRLLNGNYDAWRDYGGAIETTPNMPVPVDFGDDPGNPQYLATTGDLLAVVNGTNTDAVIVDDRSWEEYIGDSNSYYHYFHELGRIATAKWAGDWTELVRDNANYLVNYTDIEQRWAEAGLTPEKQMYFYCGTGWRSGLYTFYAYLMGWPAANYDGGWFEWSYYDNPRKIGTP